MKKIIFILPVLLITSLLQAQSFQTEISDTTHFIYYPSSDIFEYNNNTYGFFQTRCPIDSIDSTGFVKGSLNYFRLDSSGHIIIDTVLFPNLIVSTAFAIKTANNDYFVFIANMNKTNSSNGKILKLDSAFNIVSEKNLPLVGDSTFIYTQRVIQIENNNVLFTWNQFLPPTNEPKTFIYKTNTNLDSLNFISFYPFLSKTFTFDTTGNQYIVAPMEPFDTLFLYLGYDLQIDSVDTLVVYNQYSPNGITGRWQNSLILLSNHKKIYSCTGTSSSEPHYLMDIYLLDNNNNVLNHHSIGGKAYPGEYENLAYIPNSKYFYFTGNTGYMGQPDDTDSFILARIDTNLNIDFVRYLHFDRYHRPLYIKTTSDNGCIILGNLNYIVNHNQNQILVQGAYIVKFDSLGNLSWSHGIDIQEQVALVYPNPAKDVLFVQNGLNSRTHARFILLDIKGKQVLNKPLAPQENQIPVSTLPQGIYLYQIADKEKIYQTGKIVKQ